MNRQIKTNILIDEEKNILDTDIINKYVVIIQKWIRGYLIRKKILVVPSYYQTKI